MDTSGISKYTIEETNEYVVVEFNDGCTMEFFNAFKSAFNLKASKLAVFDTVDCVGEDDFIYIISSGGIEKQNTKSEYSLKKLKRIKSKNYRLCRKVECYAEQLLSTNKSTASIFNFSLSKYKKYTFVSKENNIAFEYRMKKAKKDNSRLLYIFTAVVPAEQTTLSNTMNIRFLLLAESLKVTTVRL